MDTSRLGQPVFLGFDAKRPDRLWEWRDCLPSHVEQICSATGCQADSVDTEILIRHPDWCGHGFLASEESLRRAVAEEAADPAHAGEAQTKPPYEMFAYRIHPVWFAQDGLHEGMHPDAEAPAREARPDLSAYERLGYDLLEVTHGTFGCSPLSCNGMANEIPVNRWCLLDTLEAAVETALRFGREQPEPGDYVIVEVWRSSR